MRLDLETLDQYQTSFNSRCMKTLIWGVNNKVAEE